MILLVEDNPDHVALTIRALKKNQIARLRSSVTPGASGAVFSVFLPEKLESQLQVA